MNCETEADRAALLKALRGSNAIGSRSVTQATDLNRSPFNMLLFIERKRYFDEAPGVIILPILEMADLINWRGTPYSVVILCSAALRTITPAQMSVRIGLTSTKTEFVQEASAEDLDKAVGILRAVVKASAYCLHDLPGPDTHRAQVLWSKFRDSAHQSRVSGQSYLRRNLDGHILVPSDPITIPHGKFVTKINLANMAPESGTAAYPDPLLVAYKSSINWTRQHQFQLMAEAEPQDLECPGDTGHSTVTGMSDRSIPDEVAIDCGHTKIISALLLCD